MDRNIKKVRKILDKDPNGMSRMLAKELKVWNFTKYLRLYNIAFKSYGKIFVLNNAYMYKSFI